MSITLEHSPEAMRSSFLALQEPSDVAEMLDVKYNDLIYWIYRTPERDRYTTFSILKKNGSARHIDTPNKNIMILQRKLNQVLQSVYVPKPSVHGFVSARNVKSNAKPHVNKKWVFNIDLNDFFHTINFGRVRGMFMGRPYHLQASAATVLAHLCCFQGRLPKGADFSCGRNRFAPNGQQLQQLAKNNRATYTRYADDITFSTTNRRFPGDLAFLDELDQIQVGEALNNIIERNGFQINGTKVSLRARHQRQGVTNVTVNDVLNVPRKFVNQIRAMLYVWRHHGLPAAQKTWETKNATKHRGPGKSAPRFEHVVKGKIEYLGMIKGPTSQTYLKFMDELAELAPELAQGRGTPMRILLRKYNEFKDTLAQSRGTNSKLLSCCYPVGS